MATLTTNKSVATFTGGISRLWASQEACIATVGVVGALALGWTIASGKWLYLAGLVLVAAIPAVVRWPVEMSLGLYAFLVPFDSIAALGEGTSGTTVTKLVGAGAAAVLLAVGLVARRLTRPPVAALWWSLFILWAVSTSLWAINGELALGRLPMAAGLLLVYLVAVSLRVSEEELSHVGTLAIAGGVAAAAYTCYAYAQGVSYHGFSHRASLIVGERQTDPNQFAASLLLPLSLALTQFVSVRAWFHKLLLLGGILTITTSLYLTMSRGSLLALAVVVLAYVYHTGLNWRTLLPLAALAASLPFLPEQFFKRLDMDRGHEELSAGRTTVWQWGLDAVQEYGLFGAGWDTYGLLTPKGSHNIYLGMWVELGIIGLLLLFAAIFAQLRAVKAWRRKSARGPDGYVLAILCTCLGLLAAGFFLDILWRKTFWLAWILLSLGASLSRRLGQRAHV